MSKNFSVLCVDDDENVLRALQRVLIDEEFEAFFAKDADTATMLMESREISMVIADMKMPKKDGLTFLQEVRDKWPMTIRVVLSGYLHLPQIIAAINAVGIYRFIQKPYRVQEDLLAVIRAGLAHYKNLKEQEQVNAALKSRIQTYQNIVKRVNEDIEGAKHGTLMMAKVGKCIFQALLKIELKQIEGGVKQELLLKTSRLYEEIGSLAALEYEAMELGEVMDKLASALEVLEEVKRVDIEKGEIFASRVRIKEGLVTYGLTQLVDNMLPGIKKYVKIFLQESADKDRLSLLCILSPIHREESGKIQLKTLMQPLFLALAKMILESQGGSFELVNKGTRYLIKAELPDVRRRIHPTAMQHKAE